MEYKIIENGKFDGDDYILSSSKLCLEDINKIINKRYLKMNDERSTESYIVYTLRFENRTDIFELMDTYEKMTGQKNSSGIGFQKKDYESDYNDFITEYRDAMNNRIEIKTRNQGSRFNIYVSGISSNLEKVSNYYDNVVVNMFGMIDEKKSGRSRR